MIISCLLNVKIFKFGTNKLKLDEKSTKEIDADLAQNEM